MRIFEFCYDKTMHWARHRHAQWYLGSMSFAESVFFPIPPDVMLAPMSLSRPDKAWWYALVTTVGSVLGGILGFILGWFAFEGIIQPLVEQWGYQAKLEHAMQWFSEYGIWVVFLAGFTPIPYKVFTISAGAMHMAFIPFIIASTIGRGARFFLVAGLMYWGGAPFEKKLRQHIDTLGWATILLALLAYFILR
ncbi:YqaA family protein [Planctobacterium marinum]|uniref:YqaA family protein n=1 Tax=Planctobacterium marinum TaxID=1631968 RepID=UPI001E491456|nr:YqaA family protein [Planctobacterium marinum]MCC2605267.1 DedA family protein [Planctobacterium marinum]